MAEQQSAAAVQGAPSGAQASRHARRPVRLGAHTPEQQSRASLQERPAFRHASPAVHRPLTSQVAESSQHSSFFLHDSPVDLQPGLSSHRSTPWGTLRHTPEQQSSFDWQRSSLGKQPPAPWHRPSLPQTPEQQAFESGHRSPTTLQPGRALQVAVPGGPGWHSPVQQSVPLLQVSPATLHPPSRTQASVPSPIAAHWPAQHSGSAAHVSPATRHSGAGAAHFPASHAPEQQSLEMVQAPLAAMQGLPPHRPSLEQPRLQHAPARLQASPSLTQPCTDAQASWPLPFC